MNSVIRSVAALAVVLVAMTALVVDLNFPAIAQQQTVLGGVLPGLADPEQRMWDRGKERFDRSWGPSEGMGVVFTRFSCKSCHGVPASGGGSAIRNTLFGKLNADGSFNPMENKGGMLLQNDSVTRFLLNTCTLAGETVPSDANVISRRISPPVFGLGLVDSIPDDQILAHAVDKGDGIRGTASMLPDHTGTVRVARFGAKAHITNLLMFTADAFNNELGISNPLFPAEHLPQGNPIPPDCDFSRSDPDNTTDSNIMQLFHFNLFLAPNSPAALTATAEEGRQKFEAIGCAKCHVPTMTTAAGVMVPLDLAGSAIGPSAALSNQAVNLYSDLLLHDMGQKLADRAAMQGVATARQWRTIPLWGLSQKTQFLHDGRTFNLNTAIITHGGEAQIVIDRYNALTQAERDKIMEFLRGL